ncbi:c-type cytochrome [Rubellimicrobium aerolatum]|uniref:C-type cytochrome n=1 Tax=Rubellimicrobium aerolatum TaxID=490979 RepID=A0ABW0S872_9RHOB|nr:cytochrome c [Rubellimicrobium aerolatum]MBP1804325.1 cytochrome c556 [Rubellimicrobium aerolatum]
MRRLTKIACLAATALTATSALAQDQSPEQTALEIRQGHMLNYAANLGVVGGMARGDREYDAAAAQVAADNLLHLASINQSYYWPEGTSNADMEESRALPAIWENMADFDAKQETLLQAVTALQAAAGTDLATLQGAMGAVGQSCGGCHEDYRESDE